MKTIITFILSIICAFVCAHGQALLTAEKVEELEAYIDHFEKNDQLIGSIAINESGKEVFARDFGSLERSAESNKRQGTIGSITKMFTAVALAQIEDEGKIDLDNTLNNYFPDLPNADKITLQHMLDHTSGLKDYVVKGDNMELWLNEPVTDEEIIAEITRQGVSFAPGDSLDYSNSAFFLLGKVLENNQGKVYHQIIDERIISPLGLDHTFVIHPETDVSEVESSYKKKGSGWEIMEEFYFPNAFSAGAMVSSTTDMNDFLIGLFAGKVISESTLKDLLPVGEDWFGSGIMRAPFYEHIAYGHSGGTYGTHSLATYNPDNELAVSYFINGENFPANDFAIGILSIIYGKAYELPKFNAYDVDLESLAAYTGKYVTDLLPMDITIFLEEGQLMAQGDGQPSFILEPVAENSFEYRPAGVVITFQPAESTMILHQSGAEFLMSKENQMVEAAADQESTLDLEPYTGTYTSALLPIDLTVFVEGDKLRAQGEGQPAFTLTKVNLHTYTYDQADLKIEFYPDTRSMTLNQAGHSFDMTVK